MKKLIFAFLFLLNHATQAQPSEQTYTVTYNGSSDYVSIDIRLPKAHKGPVQLIIPRSAPGSYGVVFYDHYLSSIKGYDDNGNVVSVTRGEGPRWIIGDSASNVLHITYDMDLKKMEKEELMSTNASKIRSNYVGILGYSVFGFIDGFEYTKIKLFIKAPEGWPVFTTLSPKVPLIKSKMELPVDNFDVLADAQIMMGTALKVKRFGDGPVPLYVAQYAEVKGDSSINNIGETGVSSMKLLHQYFGQTPFPYYTIDVEYLKPLDSLHEYNWAMEHLNSQTASLDTSKIHRASVGGILHHICHAYIPLRCYGKGYRPFTWEMAPIIKTIWFNEGFVQYITLQLLHINGIDRNKKRVDEAPAFLKNMSLTELSEMASTQYASDPRIGDQVMARGFLMANDLDNYIKGKTDNKKSLRDALVYLFDWSQRNKKAFTIEELPGIFQHATGVNVKPVFDEWIKPMTELKIESLQP